MSTTTVSSPKKGKSQGVIAKWDHDNSRMLLEVLDYEIARGNRPGGVLSKTGWFNVIQNFKSRTDLDYNTDQLKNRLDNLRREFIKWEKLIAKEAGLGWDNEKRTLAAPESWWYERAKSDPGILKYKEGGPLNLDLMQKVFAGIAATGKYAYNPFTPDSDSLLDAGARLERLEDIIDFTADNNGEPPMTETRNEEPVEVNTNATPSTSKLRSQKRRRISSGGRVSEIEKYSNTVESITDTIKEGMKFYSQAKAMDVDSKSYANAIEVLQTVPGMEPSSDAFMKAVRILEDKMRRVAFISMVSLGEDLLRKWLATFPDI